MAKTPLNADQLNRALATQVGFIERSADAFDRGFRDEALRIATTIRVLVHHTPRSHALLEQLGVLSTSKFLDTAGIYDPRNLMPTHNLVMIAMNVGYQVGLDFNGTAASWVPFTDWWERIVLADPGVPMTMTRKQLVLTAANQDGGAHVDPSLDAAYDSMKSGPAWWTFEDSAGASRGLDAIHLFSLRQIAHEVLASLSENYPLQGPSDIPATALKRPPRP